jgi:hypothetical protein
MKKKNYGNPSSSNGNLPKRFTLETNDENRKRKIQYQNSLLGIIIFFPQ